MTLKSVNSASEVHLTRVLINLKARAQKVGVSLDDHTILTLTALDAALDKAGTDTSTRFALKSDLHRAGLLAA